MKLRYCIDLANYERFPSRVVNVGDIALGGSNPVRIQSMTNTNTMDLRATVDQSKRIFDAGADFVRITTPGEKEAKFLKEIKNTLHKEGYTKPLIADIHFNPKAAEIAAEIVEKVRLNPGNYVDPRANFKRGEISNIAYDEELERMHERLRPLIDICKRNGTTIRLGSNYGSLSDRIMNRYGNTPEGMVEAAMEFYRIFRIESFDKLVMSMKASNPIVMVEASRLLNARMMEEGVAFPQHLGVTEAGEGYEGRLRSAIGVGALLADGIGDTVRVSLTEAPEVEIPVAQKLVRQFARKIPGVQRLPIHIPEYDSFIPLDKTEFPEVFKRPSVTVDLREFKSVDEKVLNDLYFSWDEKSEIWEPGKRSPECILVTKKNMPEKQVKVLSFVDNVDLFHAHKIDKTKNNFATECLYDDFDAREIIDLCESKKPIFILKTETDNPTGELRSFISKLNGSEQNCPIILDIQSQKLEPLLLAAEYGAALIENRIAGIMVKPNTKDNDVGQTLELAWDLLQSAGIRRSKVEFISCPGCGRTLYDLESTVKVIKREFAHLEGLKIAVMGCIVNGPGEMLDADYGYIGAGNGKVSLYKGKTPVLKNIPETEAVERLKELLKKNNDWKELKK